MKQRISALDLLLLGEELKKNVEHYRLTNIYNVSDSSRQFLLKFNKTENKCSVVIDCGLRIHTTNFNRPIPPAPSGFVVKLRKHLKSKRLTALRQIKNDRILVLQFADGLFYLVLEFFSAGNVILLDENRKILSLQRIVHEHENRVGEVYDMFDESLFVDNPEDDVVERRTYTSELVESWFSEVQEKFKTDTKISGDLENGGKKKLKIPSIHKLLLSKVPHLSSDLISKNLKEAGINPSSSSLEYLDKLNEITSLLTNTENDYIQLITNKVPVGYILAKKNINYNAEKDSQETEYLYETFHPFKPYIDPPDVDSTKVVEIEGPYNNTLDAFFSTIESSKYALRIQNQEILAQKKLDDARNENQVKINALQDVQVLNEEKGNLIVEKADLVEEIKEAVQGLIDQQMDWNAIENIIKNEQKKNNKIAKLIVLPLNLKENRINIILPRDDDNSDDSDSDSNSSSESDISDSSDDSESSDDETDERRVSKKIAGKTQNFKRSTVKGTKITIDLTLSAYANASEYFGKKKNSAEKQKKVEKNAEKALKNIEERIKLQLDKKLRDSHDVLKRIRTPYFFERFNWFFSSEGFLVLMGKSPVDTDQIYSKYIEDDDIYMTNTFGTQVWIKNPEKTEIPPNTLMQAGILCMSASEAWSKKIASSPLWCFAKNVSKFSTDNKTVLSAGIFRIKNEKEQNFLPPAQLVMGFGFLWKLKTENSENQFEEEKETGKQETSIDDDDELEISDELFKGKMNEEDAEQGINQEYQKEESDSFDVIDGISDEINKLKLEESNDISESDSDDERNEFDATKTVATVLTNMSKNVRGKKGKLKKMKKKYADQDENERLLRLQALGTLKGLEKQQEKEKEEITRQEERELRKSKQAKAKLQQALSFTQGEKVKVDFNRFKTELKPTLDKDDEIVDIIPVFAPWPALLKYKYKIKVQPGTAKKTKTINDILHHFLGRKVDSTKTDKELDWNMEHDIIKTLKAQELVLCISADKLKISIPGQNSQHDKSKGLSKNSGSNKKSKSNKKKK